MAESTEMLYREGWSDAEDGFGCEPPYDGTREDLNEAYRKGYVAYLKSTEGANQWPA